MRAAIYRETGPARKVLRLGDLPDPEPGPGEVRVRVATSGVNPSDVKTRAGKGLRGGFEMVVPHSDGAGRIDRVGEGVDRDRLGQRVWTWNAQIRRPFGTAAEYVVLPGEQAVPLPDEVSYEAGACLGVPWLTAWRAVHHRPAERPGEETILIAGGAGSVGGYAIQLARLAGFRVLATVSSPEKAEVARSLGAHEVIDYRAEDAPARVRDLCGHDGVDRIVEVDLATNARLYPQILKRGGLSIVYGSSDWGAPLPLGALLVHGVEIALFNVYELGSVIRSAALRHSRDVLADSGFKHSIGARFDLADIAEAHEAVEGGRVIGNVVVSIDGGAD